MRDLYARLGLGFGADEAALRKALRNSTDAELRRRAEAILLDPPRRAGHDAVYRVARALRDWRIELHLEDGDWARALADSDLIRPDLPTEPLRRPATASPRPWWRRFWPG